MVVALLLCCCPRRSRRRRRRCERHRDVSRDDDARKAGWRIKVGHPREGRSRSDVMVAAVVVVVGKGLLLLVVEQRGRRVVDGGGESGGVCRQARRRGRRRRGIHHCSSCFHSFARSLPFQKMRQRALCVLSLPVYVSIRGKRERE